MEERKFSLFERLKKGARKAKNAVLKKFPGTEAYQAEQLRGFFLDEEGPDLNELNSSEEIYEFSNSEDQRPVVGQSPRHGNMLDVPIEREDDPESLEDVPLQEDPEERRARALNAPPPARPVPILPEESDSEAPPSYEAPLPPRRDLE
jgi:hypothetical protein